MRNSFESGLVEVPAAPTRRRVINLISQIELGQKLDDENTIRQEIKSTAKRKWFGLLPGKEITREKAIERLDKWEKNQRGFRWWRSSRGCSEQFDLTVIRDMCEVSPDTTKILLSSEQASLILQCEKKYTVNI